MKLRQRVYLGLIGLLMTVLLAGGLNRQIWAAGGVVSSYGQLQVVNGKLCNSAGTPVALHGMSLFWTNWDPGFYNYSALQTLRDNWKCTVVRAAMGIEAVGGYLTNPESQKQKVTAAVDAAIGLGMYVIIDWHDHAAQNHTSQAKAFFAEMAQKYGSYPNVIYEIYNEPMNVGWSAIKSYAMEVISAIRQYDSDNIIIVGTPTWSQDVDTAANDPITGSNIMYTLHFYAATHKQFLRDKANTALKKKLPIFVTEWGTCDSSGAGSVDSNESDTWIKYMSDNNLSWCNWSLNTKAETCSALASWAGTTGNWQDNALTTSGTYVRNKLISLYTEPTIAPPKSTVTPTPAVTATPVVTKTPVVTATPAATVTSAPTAGPGQKYAVSYAQNDWGSGATVTVTIKNNSKTAVNGWSLAWQYTGNQKITNLWNAEYSQSGRAITITNAASNGTIAADGSVSFGFSISYSGTNTRPERFSLNGVVCQ